MGFIIDGHRRHLVPLFRADHRKISGHPLRCRLLMDQVVSEIRSRFSKEACASRTWHESSHPPRGAGWQAAHDVRGSGSMGIALMVEGLRRGVRAEVGSPVSWYRQKYRTHSRGDAPAPPGIVPEHHESVRAGGSSHPRSWTWRTGRDGGSREGRPVSSRGTVTGCWGRHGRGTNPWPRCAPSPRRTGPQGRTVCRMRRMSLPELDAPRNPDMTEREGQNPDVCYKTIVASIIDVPTSIDAQSCGMGCDRRFGRADRSRA